EELKGTSGVSMYNGEVNFEAADTVLHPGMSAMLKIYLEEPTKGLVIPRKAVIEEEGKFFVVTESKKVELTGSFINEFKFEVLSGLKAGDRVQILSQGGT
ncbi:MAG: hypothetical protein NE327_00830, partial [Lentisphaeraceae bacterium]|nr:hypothetical protein [Lentisphaeraceae bacterium]